MNFELQPSLETETAFIVPLKEEDFDGLYAVASDPKVWAQHPNKDRWQVPIFRNFFTGAMESQGAFKIVDKVSGKILGSTRFYDYSSEDDSTFIGYTFYAADLWGTGLNHAVKRAMLAHAFRFVSRVLFHIGATNFPSQNSITRLGAQKIDEVTIPYFGEAPRHNFVYEIRRDTK